MRVTDFTRGALEYRRFKRRMLAAGYEEIGEGGGRLWELRRGWRHAHRIVAVEIEPGGKSLWAKIEKASAAAAEAETAGG